MCMLKKITFCPHFPIPQNWSKILQKKNLKNQTTSLTSFIKNLKEYYLLYYYILLNYTRYEVDFNGWCELLFLDFFNACKIMLKISGDEKKGNKGSHQLFNRCLKKKKRKKNEELLKNRFIVHHHSYCCSQNSNFIPTERIKKINLSPSIFWPRKKNYECWFPPTSSSSLF